MEGKVVTSASLSVTTFYLFNPGTAGYEPGKRCAADLKFHSVFLKSATIKVGQR